MMTSITSCVLSSLREILKASGTLLLPLAIPGAIPALEVQSLSTANAGTDPYPIPWLDKNGSHNQPAALNLEPSHIYHSRGAAAHSLGRARITREIESPLGAGRATQQGLHTHLTYAISGTGCPCQSDS